MTLADNAGCRMPPDLISISGLLPHSLYHMGASTSTRTKHPWKLFEDHDPYVPRRGGRSIGARSSLRPRPLTSTHGRHTGRPRSRDHFCWITGLEPETLPVRGVVNDDALATASGWTGAGATPDSSPRRSLRNEFRRTPILRSSLRYFTSSCWLLRHRHPESRRSDASGRLRRSTFLRSARPPPYHHRRLHISPSPASFGSPLNHTGDEDEDWFFRFFQPYRYMLTHPVTRASATTHRRDRRP